MKKYKDLERIIKLIYRTLIPLALLIAGIKLLTLRITGWSLLFGLPLTIAGAVLLIFAYDGIISAEGKSAFGKFTYCSVCGKKMPNDPELDFQEIICPDCKKGKQ